MTAIPPDPFIKGQIFYNHLDNLDAVGWLAREGKDSKAVPNLVMGQKESVVEVLEMREMDLC